MEVLNRLPPWARRVARPQVAFLLLALLVTWPMPLHPLTTVIGHPEASVGCHVWVIWYAQHHLPRLQTDIIFYPYGADVFRLYGSDVLSPVLLAWVPLPAGLLYNLWVLFLLWVGGMGAWRLWRELGAAPAGAFVGAVVWETAPFFQHEMLNGTSELLAAHLLPWYVLALLRTLRSPTPARGAATGLLLGLSVLASAYNLFFALLISLCVGAWRLVTDPGALFTRSLARAAAAAAGAAGLLALPLAILHRQHGVEALYTQREGWRDPTRVLPDSFADLLMWVDPRDTDIPARLVYPDGSTFSYWTTCTVYLGIVAIGLALAGTLRGRRRARGRGLLWSLLVVAVLVASGPYLRVGGKVVEVAGGPIPMPALLLAWLFPPFVITALHAYRYATVATLALAGLVSKGARRAAWAIPVLVDAVFLSPVPWPAPTTPTVATPVLRELARAPEGAVLYLPFERENLGDLGRLLLAQTFHAKPVHDGGIHRRAGPEATRLFRENLLVNRLTSRGTPAFPGPRETAASFDQLREIGYRYVLTPTPDTRINDWLADQLDAPLAHDEVWTLWHL